jgi:hypothetical protein
MIFILIFIDLEDVHYGISPILITILYGTLLLIIVPKITMSLSLLVPKSGAR